MSANYETQIRCGKVRYESKRQAATVRNAVMRRHNRRVKRLRIYPCANCGGWHLTKSV